MLEVSSEDLTDKVKYRPDDKIRNVHTRAAACLVSGGISAGDVERIDAVPQQRRRCEQVGRERSGYLVGIAEIVGGDLGDFALLRDVRVAGIGDRYSKRYRIDLQIWHQDRGSCRHR